MTFDYNKYNERTFIKWGGVNGVIVGATTRFIGKGYPSKGWNGRGSLKVEHSLTVWKI